MEPVRLDFTYRPVDIKFGVRHGFLVHPAKDGVSWGEPFFAADGSRIDPGTEGGPNSNVVVGRKTGTWKKLRSVSKQVAGNIDWVGEEIPKSKDRPVVSVHGPASRYFNLADNFEYDSEENHEIYMNGMVLAVAPKPVLGACIKKTTRTNNLGAVEDVTWIVAFCKNGADVTAYIKPMLFLVLAEKLSAARAGMMRMFDADKHPSGWVELTSQSFSGWTPNTPFFFSSDGTQARATKWIDHEYDDGGGNTVTDKVPVIVSATIAYTNEGVTVSYADSGYTGTGFLWTEKTKKIHENWTSEWQDSYELYHSWWNQTITVNISQKGSLPICVDYDFKNARWLRCSYVRDWARGYTHTFAKGNDPAPFVGNDGKDHSNQGQFSGFYEEGYGLTPDITRPSGRPWIGHNNQKSGFKVEVEGGAEVSFYQGTWDRSGTKSAASGQANDDDRYLYFIDCFDKVLTYADIRHSLFFGRVILLQYEAEKLTKYDLAICAKGLSFPWDEAAGSKRIVEYGDKGNGGYTGNFGWSWAKLQSDWDGQTWETTMTRTSHIAAIPTDNDTEAIQAPAWKDFTHFGVADLVDGVGAAWEPKSVSMMLDDPVGRYAQQGVFLTDLDGNLCLWCKMQFFGEPEEVVGYMYPDDTSLPTVLAYANEFLPCGVV